MPRPTHSVSDIRKGFLSRISKYSHAAEGTQSDSDTSSDSEMSYNRTKQSDKFVECFENTSLTNNSKSHNQPQFTSIVEKHVNLLQNEERVPPLTVSSDHFNCDPSSSKNEKKHRVGEESDGKFQEVRDEIGEEQDEIGEERDEIVEEQDEIYNIEMSRETLSTEFIRSGHIPEEEDVNNDDETIRSDFQESHEEWFDNDNDNILVDPTESWYGRTSYMEAALLDGSNAFDASDDDNGRRVELRELTNRGRVSNLLQSDFGASLNQLMRSYVARQDQEFESENEWMMDEDQQSLDENEDGSEVVDTEGEANTHISDFNENLNFVSVHMLQERDIINGLRVDMDTLKQRMDDMQKMMEACMTMQHELQRSVQQEVYSALNRSSNSGDGIWNHQFETKSVKEEVCYLCCDDDGDESLPNRSVHMYICSQCADKINWSKLKETVRHS
ncbi:uncharacterized protein [Rutidosis leptorrhynchoides]|uniref:uncharacterized protein n=1 Tax=Rutidosis leptorrhynchoides TaxID=125765 RepID=UPI003A9A050A